MNRSKATRSGRVVKAPEIFGAREAEAEARKPSRAVSRAGTNRSIGGSRQRPQSDHGFSFVNDDGGQSTFTSYSVQQHPHQPARQPKPRKPSPQPRTHVASGGAGGRRQRILAIEQGIEVYTQGWKVGDEKVIAHCMSAGHVALTLDIPGIGMKRVDRRETPIDLQSSFHGVGAVAWWNCKAMGLLHEVDENPNFRFYRKYQRLIHDHFYVSS